MKEHRELQTLIDQLEAHIREQAEQIDSLLKTVEALVIACKQAATDEREAINLDHRIAQAAGAKKGKVGYWEFDEHELKKFMDSIRESERFRINHQNIDVTDIILRAKAEEREACAALCAVQMSLIPAQAWTVNPYEQCMNAIRARGKK
jgi:hypothetical protein